MIIGVTRKLSAGAVSCGEGLLNRLATTYRLSTLDLSSAKAEGSMFRAPASEIFLRGFLARTIHAPRKNHDTVSIKDEGTETNSFNDVYDAGQCSKFSQVSASELRFAGHRAFPA
jgi:hypothetical protein